MDIIKVFGTNVRKYRIKKGVSESQMSYDLGHSRSYINNITSGKSLPSMIEFFYICDYFEITPFEFYNIENKKSKYLFQNFYNKLIY